MSTFFRKKTAKANIRLLEAGKKNVPLRAVFWGEIEHMIKNLHEMQKNDWNFVKILKYTCPNISMIQGIVMTDETDKKILAILLENARLSFRKVAKKAGVSVATVMNHVNRLEKEGIIKGYVTELDYEKMGYDMEAIVEVKIARDKGNPFDVDPFILKHPNVHVIMDVSGEIDHILMVKFQTRRQLAEFLRKLNSLPSIQHSQTRFILKNFKESRVRV